MLDLRMFPVSDQFIAPERSGGASYSESKFQTTKCPSVRSSVRKKRKRKTPKIRVPVTLTYYLQYLPSRFSRNDLPGP